MQDYAQLWHEVVTTDGETSWLDESATEDPSSDGSYSGVNSSSTDDESTLRQKMNAAVREDGTKVYTLATGLSLLIFYVLAMQCMSTLAIVKRETKSWKWPAIQFVYMTALAYAMSWLVYVLFK